MLTEITDAPWNILAYIKNRSRNASVYAAGKKGREVFWSGPKMGLHFIIMKLMAFEMKLRFENALTEWT